MCNLISRGDHTRYHCIHKEHRAASQSLIYTRSIIWRSLALCIKMITTALSKEGYYHYMRVSTKKKIWLATQSYHSEIYHRHILMNWLEYRTDPIKTKKNRICIQCNVLRSWGSNLSRTTLPSLINNSFKDFEIIRISSCCATINTIHIKSRFLCLPLW